MRKVKLEDIFPKSLDIGLVLKILKDRGFEVGEIEGQKGLVVFDEEEDEPLGTLEEIWEYIKYEYNAYIILRYLKEERDKNPKFAMATLDLKNQQLIIYEIDKDKELVKREIKRLNEKGHNEDLEETPIYIR